MLAKKWKEGRKDEGGRNSRILGLND